MKFEIKNSENPDYKIIETNLHLTSVLIEMNKGEAFGKDLPKKLKKLQQNYSKLKA